MLQLFKTKTASSENKSTSDSVHRAEAVNSFVELLAREYFLDEPDRRSRPRVKLTLPVTAETLDEQLQPTGQQMRAVTRDISASGIGLVCQDPVGAKYLVINLVSPCGTAFDLVAEVLRCEPVGYYFDVGCKICVERDETA